VLLAAALAAADAETAGGLACDVDAGDGSCNHEWISGSVFDAYCRRVSGTEVRGAMGGWL